MVETIKRVALQAFEESTPSGVFFGQVVSAEPLKIQIEQKLTLGSKNLVLTESVTDLVVGDKVILLRVQGGQQFVVSDRIRG